MLYFFLRIEIVQFFFSIQKTKTKHLQKWGYFCSKKAVHPTNKTERNSKNSQVSKKKEERVYFSCICEDISAPRKLFTQQSKTEGTQISSNHQRKRKECIFLTFVIGWKKSCFCFGTEIFTHLLLHFLSCLLWMYKTVYVEKFSQFPSLSLEVVILCFFVLFFWLFVCHKHNFFCPVLQKTNNVQNKSDKIKHFQLFPRFWLDELDSKLANKNGPIVSKTIHWNRAKSTNTTGSSWCGLWPWETNWKSWWFFLAAAHTQQRKLTHVHLLLLQIFSHRFQKMFQCLKEWAF